MTRYWKYFIDFIGDFFGGLFEKAQSNAEDIARATVLIAGIVTLTTGVFATIGALISSISVVLPPDFNTAMRMVLPDNTSICVAAIISGKLASWVYGWSVHFLETINESIN